MWTLFLNSGRIMVGARPLADGGLLVMLDGRNHSVYWREEVGALRLMVDTKTCLIEQENDPTQLSSPSPGKLVRFLIDSGDHINAGETYAEIEVMKIYMPLVAAEDGVVQFVKQPGVSLEPGDILGILTLDEPARASSLLWVSLASLATRPISISMSTPNDILEGNDNQVIMASTFKDLIEMLQLLNPSKVLYFFRV
ncbi:acetyl CoA carboxylase [Suillus clintonianus]|uniref:acetyl CoA carboxylase n=1 Tax=Suillus clintonianus TaxID=1904413 RepID=UPI001B85CFF9|nr:acetyl CoA carboxylase [Suillus clintonianus]KAG2112772.1 acetyl CoA carboxylase [Suillus clintonianus]